MDNPRSNESVALLHNTMVDLQFAVDRIMEWPKPPDASIVAAWGPLLSEKLIRIEEVLSRCERRLEPLQTSVPDSVSEFRLGMPMSEVERIHILRTLKFVDGNREKAARLLEVGARTLYRKLKEYGEK